MTDIVVMGACGMLGRALMRVGKAKGLGIVGYTHSDCDIADTRALTWCAPSHQDATIINAAGIVRHHDKVYPDPDYRSRMYRVNILGPKTLAGFFKRVVQVSSDCVFSGELGYETERSRPDATDDYGLSKLGGELPEPHLTIRTSFVGFGPRGFLRRMVLDQPDGATIKGYSNWLWSGFYVDCAAELILTAAVNPDMTGLYHLGGNVISKAELLQRVCAAIRPDIKVEVTSEQPPRRMVLESVRWHPAVPTWGEQIERLANDYRLYSSGAL